MPGLIRLTKTGRLVINQASVEQRLGRPWETHELQLAIISYFGEFGTRGVGYEVPRLIAEQVVRTRTSPARGAASPPALISARFSPTYQRARAGIAAT